MSPFQRRTYFRKTFHQSQNYFTIGGLPPFSSSWRQAPWYSRQAFFFQLNSCGHSPYVASSLTRDLPQSKSKLFYDWRFTANHFVLAPSPLRFTTRFFFFQLNPCGSSLYVTSSLTRRGICFLLICSAFRQLYVSHLQHVIGTSFFCTIYKCSVSTGFAKQIMPILRILFYNGSLTTAKFTPLIFSVSRFALSYTTNMFILMVLYDFCLSPAQLYERPPISQSESCYDWRSVCQSVLE
jgi:hypothetical protein